MDMAKNDLKKVLNDLIGETGRKQAEIDLSHIVTLDLPVRRISPGLVSVDLNEIVIFEGVQHIVARLLHEMRESSFFGQSDISVNINVEHDICPQLYDIGIRQVFFYSLIESMEQLALHFKDITNHLRYIFNALQSPAINRGFLTRDPEKETNNSALLFPFNREVEGDLSGLHYLVERVPGSHFLRITAESLDHSRLNFRRIPHRIVSNIELVSDSFQVNQDAFTIYSSILNRCRDNKLSYKDAGLQLSSLLHFLRSAGYPGLREITLNWPREVANDLLTVQDQRWQGNIKRTLLILADPTTLNLLLSGTTIETNFASARAFLSLTQLNRNLQIDLQEETVTVSLENYLSKMEMLSEAVEKKERPLSNLHLVFIHHFTAETLAAMGAFDKLGIHTVDTLWVLYSGSTPAKYLETILSLPSSVFRFYGMQKLTGTNFRDKFCLSDRYSPIDDFSALQQQLQDGEFEYYDAMQRMGMHLFLEAMLNGQNTRIMIAEDGGYLAPLVNRLVLEKCTVGEVFKRFGFTGESPDQALPSKDFGGWIRPRFCGSVEHTRNGFDALMAVKKEFSALAFPACSLAISRFKVNDEAIEVAYSCLNAIENILGSLGFVLSNRNALVLGSLGAIGMQVMNILLGRLGKGCLAGVDIRCDHNRSFGWEQVDSPAAVSETAIRSVDLIFGVVGKSILDVAFFEQMILKTGRKSIFLASGSTKQFEFSEFLEWTAALLASENPVLNGFPLKIGSAPFEDPQSAALLGSVVSFDLATESGIKTVDFYLLGNLMPVNFQYYGVARETMDTVMTEFVSLVKIVSRAEEMGLPCDLLALDHTIDLEGNLL